MATKTISLELDAYEYLLQQKRAGESFSEVVRRAAFPPTQDNRDNLLNDAAAGYRTTARTRASTGRRQHRQVLPIAGWNKEAIGSFEAATRRQEMRNREWTVGPVAPERGWTRNALYEEEGDSLEQPH